MNNLILFLLLLSGIAWTIVYLVSIYIGFKKDTCCMPLWALALNICWEFIYSINGMQDFSIQTIVNIIWAVCDVLIVVTYFRSGKKYLAEKYQDIFLPYSIAAFISCFIIQLAFFWHFENKIEAAQYSAFLQNAFMSIMFVIMHYKRDKNEGQSLCIAVCKWIGTLAPAIQQGLLQDVNIYILLTGLLCSVWDIYYIYLLIIDRKESEGK